MSHYLEQFRSSLPTVQGRQVLKLLQKKKDSGEITSVEEFKARLQELTETLLSDEIVPSLKIFLAKVDDVIDSSTYNFMLERIQDDLEAAFTELNTIEEVLAAHNQIVNQVVLKSIQLAINDISDRITLHEFVNANPSGFNKGQFNTFSTIKAAPTSRDSAVGNVLYQDTLSEQDALIDTVGERLILGNEDSTYVTVQFAEQIFDSDVSSSELDVRIPDSLISNIVDGQKDTFWAYNTLLSKPKTSGVIQKVMLDMAASQDINFIEIEPASPYPMLLTKVSYFNNAGTEVDTGLASVVAPVELKKPIKLHFGKVTARKVILTIKQNNYSEVQFEERNSDPVNAALRDVLTSDFYLEELLGVPRVPSAVPSHKLYQYIVGIDNIRLGLSDYKTRSSFASQALEVEKPGMVAVRVTETRPTIKNASDASANYSGSFEYEIVKENLDDQDRLISIDRFPIPPAGLVDVTHERLDLEYKILSATTPNAGVLRFYPDTDTASASATATGGYVPRVYRNGTLLKNPFVAGSEWAYVTTGDSPITVTSATDVNKMAQGIRILSPSVSDIYTVSYRIRLGNTTELPSTSVLNYATNKFNVVNMGQASRNRLVTGNIVMTDRKLPSADIAKSRVYLIIVLRRNQTDASLTHAVEDYMLLSSTEDEQKFESGLE